MMRRCRNQVAVFHQTPLDSAESFAPTSKAIGSGGEKTQGQLAPYGFLGHRQLIERSEKQAAEEITARGLAAWSGIIICARLVLGGEETVKRDERRLKA